MTSLLGVVVLTLCVALAGAGAALAAANRQPGKPFLQGVLGLQLLLLVQAAIALARLTGGQRPDDQGAFVGYLAVSVVLVPGGLFWSAQERSRYGTLVLAAVCLVVAVLQVRLTSLWSTVG